MLVIDGAIDLATLPTLRDELLRAVYRHRGETLVADLDAVTVLDDTALGVILGAAGTARQSGGDLEIVCTLPPLLTRFALTGFDRAIDVRSRVTPVRSTESID
ncbi:MAG: anti-sigma factor antagonist [Ilumatobacteraceae bacterium]|nr:anti-sigma factor antagonist [Ilumatobacteraceae bacterium]